MEKNRINKVATLLVKELSIANLGELIGRTVKVSMLNGETHSHHYVKIESVSTIGSEDEWMHLRIAFAGLSGSNGARFAAQYVYTEKMPKKINELKWIHLEFKPRGERPVWGNFGGCGITFLP